LCESATIRILSRRQITSCGCPSSAAVAFPPSPAYPVPPLPATELIEPPEETTRIQLSYSAIAISSSWSTSIPPAPASCAEVAAPPSPVWPRAPVPATTTLRPPSIR